MQAVYAPLPVRAAQSYMAALDRAEALEADCFESLAESPLSDWLRQESSHIEAMARRGSLIALLEVLIPHELLNLDVVNRGYRVELELMAKQTNAPRQITWIICLVLFLVAVLAHFRMINVSGDISAWSWIIGYAFLLVAVQVRGL